MSANHRASALLDDDAAPGVSEVTTVSMFELAFHQQRRFTDELYASRIRDLQL